jgi:hypothetical protein
MVMFQADCVFADLEAWNIQESQKQAWATRVAAEGMVLLAAGRLFKRAGHNRPAAKGAVAKTSKQSVASAVWIAKKMAEFDKIQARQQVRLLMLPLLPLLQDITAPQVANRRISQKPMTEWMKSIERRFFAATHCTRRQSAAAGPS